MTSSIIFSDHWDEICTARMGVAKLTRMAFQGQDMRALWHAMMDEATDDVAGSGMGMDLSVISQLLGDQPTGLAIQKDTLAFQRLYRSPCAAARPRLRVLALAAVMDIGGNTPLEFLLENSNIALVTYYVVPGEPLPDPMPEHDVAIVVAPDGDAARPSMQAIAALAANWPQPILNAPAAIGVLDRDRLYHKLHGIAGLEIPQTARIIIDQLHKLIADELPLRDVLEDGGFPLIIRPIGSHAGFGLAKIADRGALSDYLAGRTETEFFISRFVNYASADRMFRKYRIVMVDGKAYACHMAIAEEWKVWYLNADMALSAPHRLEEALFMQNFDQDFALRHAAALAEMAGRIGLDYVTVDCAETAEGALLVFEADNTAIVHDMDPPNVYPYKPAQMQKIFKAVQAMLYRRAGRLRADAA
jgi:glutathione synthase/RimK-type ligase-like ATP-grasp enzyme